MRHLQPTSSPISRRTFLNLGGLSVGAILPLGITLPEVLASEASGGGRKQVNVIFMFLQGGASHIDMYDMKPEAYEGSTIRRPLALPVYSSVISFPKSAPWPTSFL